jgi:DinB superfamily
MEKQFKILSATRTNILKAISDLTVDQLNTIPKGFKNNIIWNVAHVLVTQQLLCYKLSGLDMIVDSSFVDLFKKGSEADYEVSEEEVTLIKEELSNLVEKTKGDYENGVFKNYDEYPTSYDVILNCIDDAIQFNNVHEGLHLGYIMAMKKIIH